jgi:SRSO17 transposase
MTESTWAERPLLEELAWYIGERLTDPEGIFIAEETGFGKQGKKSVGVARQYSGTLGNCQVGVFLAYASRLRQACRVADRRS